MPFLIIYNISNQNYMRLLNGKAFLQILRHSIFLLLQIPYTLYGPYLKSVITTFSNKSKDRTSASIILNLI